jgi:hypothetical protein
MPQAAERCRRVMNAFVGFRRVLHRPGCRRHRRQPPGRARVSRLRTAQNGRRKHRLEGIHFVGPPAMRTVAVLTEPGHIASQARNRQKHRSCGLPKEWHRPTVNRYSVLVRGRCNSTRSHEDALSATGANRRAESTESDRGKALLSWVHNVYRFPRFPGPDTMLRTAWPDEPPDPLRTEDRAKDPAGC